MAGENENNNNAGENQNQNQNQNAGEFVSKEQYDNLVAQLNELKEEVVSPEYLEFLAGGRNGGGAKPPEKKEEKPSAPLDDLEKLSKKELVDLIAKQTKELVEGTLKTRDENAQKVEQERIRSEVAEFAKTHADFAVYRPVMYGLSLDPKYERASLNQLYEAAKAHIEGLKKGDTEEDKKRKAAMGGDRPSGASRSFEKPEAKKSVAELNAEALAETKAKFGSIPTE